MRSIGKFYDQNGFIRNAYLIFDFFDSARIMVYDLKSDARYTLTQGWDRSAKEIAVGLVIKQLMVLLT